MKYLDIFGLFFIPMGAGVPFGVSEAQARGIPWYTMIALYFAADCLFAVIFEPIMHKVRKSSAFTQIDPRFKIAFFDSMSRFGFKPDVYSLIVFTFGTDKTLGRIAAFMVGHGFWSGWTIAIIGDVLFFTFIMACTIWLGEILGSGTAAALVITVVLLVAPAIWRKFRNKFRNSAGS